MGLSVLHTGPVFFFKETYVGLNKDDLKDKVYL